MDESKKKLTDSQLRIVQVIAGILSAAALVISIYLPPSLHLDSGNLLNYSFVVVFLVIMFGRRRIENKYRLRLGLFGIVLIDGIVVGMLLYAYLAFFYPQPGTEVAMTETAKILILAGVLLLMIALGVIIPMVRYFKRKANGTLPPIRIPEPVETADEKTDKDETDSSGALTIEQQIAAMTRELDENKSNDDDEK